MDWKLGLLVHDVAGWPWVYIGCRITSVRSYERRFVKCEAGAKLSAPPWTYQAVKRDTLVAKFPDLEKLWVEEVMG